MQMQDSAEGQVDPFVELELDDPVVPNNEIHTSPIIMNEPSPRWNVKYDYIMISATSTVTATVYDKQGFFDGIMSLPKTLLGEDHVLWLLNGQCMQVDPACMTI